MLLEEGFKMVSVDASDKMLKYALKSRWERRKEATFDQWGTTFFFLPTLNKLIVQVPMLPLILKFLQVFSLN